VTGHRPGARLLRNGLLAGMVLLAAFALVAGVSRADRQPGSPASAPTTLQMAALLDGVALQKPLESGRSRLEPDISAGETGAVLAAETLLLNINSFSLGLPVVEK
jgi:hypothetical protein